MGAYSKVLQSNNYLVVLKPGAYEMGSKVENVFEKVFKEIKLPVPDQLRSQGPAQEQQPGAQPGAPAAPRPAAGANKTSHTKKP